MSSILTSLLTCWRPTDLPELELPCQSLSRVSEVESESATSDYFEPCPRHSKEIAFICKSEQCRDNSNSMSCNECLIEHKNHDWITKEEFLTPNIRNILTFRRAETDEILQATLGRLREHICRIEKEVTYQFELIKDQLERSILNIEEKYRFKVDRTLGSSKVILNKVKLEKLLNIYDIEQSRFEWIRTMEENLTKISDKIAESFGNLFQDLLNLADAEKWEYKERHIDEFREFEKHLHHHASTDDRYYRFSSTDKHMNIKLNRGMDEALYVRAVPSKPVAISSEYISQVHNRVGFEILKMNSKAIFFDCTTVFLGICSANIVKSYGYRKVNEFGKGCYLISSQGWAYHSTNEDFNNKEIVGWGFGQGDKIIVEIKFDTDCVIRFTKKGRFFENSFEMPLRLNEFQMNRLKPCVCFDSEEGAIVRIFDVLEHPKQEGAVEFSIEEMVSSGPREPSPSNLL